MMKTTRTTLSLATAMLLLAGGILSACDVEDAEPWDEERLEEEDEAGEQDDVEGLESPAASEALSVEPDAEALCCIESCGNENAACFQSVFQQRGQQCMEELLQDKPGCGTAGPSGIPGWCIDLFNDCSGYVRSWDWDETEAWADAQYADCEAEFNHCYAECPV